MSKTEDQPFPKTVSISSRYPANCFVPFLIWFGLFGFNSYTILLSKSIRSTLFPLGSTYSFFLFKKGIWCTLLEHAFVAAIRAYYSRGRCHINCNPAAFYINKSLGILTSLFRFWYNNTVCIVLKEPFQTEEI